MYRLFNRTQVTSLEKGGAEMSFLHERLDVYLNEVFLQTVFSKYLDIEYARLLIPAAVILIVIWLFLIHLLRTRTIYSPDYIMEMDKPFYV